MKLILFISITLHLLAPPCLRYEYMSFDRSFCCRSTNSMYRPSGSQYFLVRICLPCHPHLPSRPSASRLEERAEDTQQLSSPSFTSWFSESFIITVVGGDYLVDLLHWKYDDFPGPMRLPPSPCFNLKVTKLVSILFASFSSNLAQNPKSTKCS